MRHVVLNKVLQESPDQTETGTDSLKSVFENHLVEAGRVLVMLDKFDNPLHAQMLALCSVVFLWLAYQSPCASLSLEVHQQDMVRVRDLCQH